MCLDMHHAQAALSGLRLKVLRSKVTPASNIRHVASAVAEDLLANTCGSLPPGGQERRSSLSSSELTGSPAPVEKFRPELDGENLSSSVL